MLAVDLITLKILHLRITKYSSRLKNIALKKLLVMSLIFLSTLQNI